MRDSYLSTLISRIASNRRMNTGIRAMRDQVAMFGGNTERATLAGIAMQPESREYLEARIDSMWDRYSLPETAPEIVIGGGLHSAIYCATRVALGFSRPTVLESDYTPGGIFAVTDIPSFWLNSRNRPGNAGLPNSENNVNFIPSAPLQVPDISGTKFPVNTDLAFIIRLMLADSANLYVNRTVTSFDSSEMMLEMETGETIRAGRIIDARGLGKPLAKPEVNGETILSFPQLMRQMANPLPLAGMGRVAVIGNGDSARCAVESLLGLGPQQTMRSATVEYLPRIDWYARNLPLKYSAWKEQVRGRYGAIGAYLEGGGNVPRLRIINERGYPTPVPSGVLVNLDTYDRAVMATGWSRRDLIYRRSYFEPVYANGNSQTLRIASRYDGGEYYAVGPAADMSFDNNEFSQPEDSRAVLSAVRVRL